jgi:hypothetical protein
MGALDEWRRDESITDLSRGNNQYFFECRWLHELGNFIEINYFSLL